MKQDRYPAADAIADTVRHDRTSLSGARRFYSSTGVIAFANERLGLANIASRTWLGPQDARRLSAFLDMVTPAVGGLTVQPAGVMPLRLDVGPRTAVERLREIAETKENTGRGPRVACLCSLENSTAAGWDWTGTISYDHRYRLPNGQHTKGRNHAVFHVRQGAHPTQADVMVEIRYADDLEQVRSWFSHVLPPNERWGVTPFALLADRHAEFRTVVTAISGGGGVAVAHADMEKGHHSADPTKLTVFAREMRQAQYKTGMQALESLIERAETTDHALLTGFDLYYWWLAGPKQTAVKVRLKQAGTDALTITWGAVRRPTGTTGASQSTTLDSKRWDTLTSADWDEDGKMDHLRYAWGRLLAGVQAAAEAQAA